MRAVRLWDRYQRQENSRPLVEFIFKDAFAVGMRCVHVTGTDDDDFFCNARDAGGLRTETDAGDGV